MLGFAAWLYVLLLKVCAYGVTHCLPAHSFWGNSIRMSCLECSRQLPAHL